MKVVPDKGDIVQFGIKDHRNLYTYARGLVDKVNQHEKWFEIKPSLTVTGPNLQWIHNEKESFISGVLKMDFGAGETKNNGPGLTPRLKLRVPYSAIFKLVVVDSQVFSLKTMPLIELCAEFSHVLRAQESLHNSDFQDPNPRMNGVPAHGYAGYIKVLVQGGSSCRKIDLNELTALLREGTVNYLKQAPKEGSWLADALIELVDCKSEERPSGLREVLIKIINRSQKLWLPQREILERKQSNIRTVGLKAEKAQKLRANRINTSRLTCSLDISFISSVKEGLINVEEAFLEGRKKFLKDYGRKLFYNQVRGENQKGFRWLKVTNSRGHILHRPFQRNTKKELSVMYSEWIFKTREWEYFAWCPYCLHRKGPLYPSTPKIFKQKEYPREMFCCCTMCSYNRVAYGTKEFAPVLFLPIDLASEQMKEESNNLRNIMRLASKAGIEIKTSSNGNLEFVYGENNEA